MDEKKLKEILINHNLLYLIDVHFANYICNLQDNSENPQDLWLLSAFVSFFSNQGDSAFSLDTVSNKNLQDIFPLKEKKNKLQDEEDKSDEIAVIKLKDFNQAELLKNNDLLDCLRKNQPLSRTK